MHIYLNVNIEEVISLLPNFLKYNFVLISDRGRVNLILMRGIGIVIRAVG